MKVKFDKFRFKNEYEDDSLHDSFFSKDDDDSLRDSFFSDEVEDTLYSNRFIESEEESDDDIAKLLKEEDEREDIDGQLTDGSERAVLKRASALAALNVLELKDDEDEGKSPNSLQFRWNDDFDPTSAEILDESVTFKPNRKVNLFNINDKAGRIVIDGGTLKIFQEKKGNKEMDTLVLSVIWGSWMIKDSDIFNKFFIYKIKEDNEHNKHILRDEDGTTYERCYICLATQGAEQKLRILSKAEFMESLADSNEKKAKSPRSKKLFKKFNKVLDSSSANDRNEDHVSKMQKNHLIKPLPEEAYPHMWLTLPQLHTEMNKESKVIKDFRSRPTNMKGACLGYIFVEILTCVGLKKISTLRKAFCSVSCLFEEFSYQTDSVPFDINPMWLSRGKRAAIFPIYHIHGRVYIGVWHHYGTRDDLAGRVVIEISEVKPSTKYDVALPLRSAGDEYERAKEKSKGVIRLRFEAHFFDERKAVLSYPQYILSKEKIIVPSAGDKDFVNTAKLVHGKTVNYSLYDKYSNRAIAREHKLYKVEMKIFVKRFFLELCLWENPKLSMYCFCSVMLCSYCSSVALALPCFLGTLLVILSDNHAEYVSNEIRNFGYCKPSYGELLRALLFGGNGHFLPTKLKPQKIREHNFHNMLFPLSNPKYTQRFKFSHFVKNEQFEDKCQLEHRFLRSSAATSEDISNIQSRSSEHSKDVSVKSTTVEGDLDVAIYSGAASKKIAQFQDVDKFEKKNYGKMKEVEIELKKLERLGHKMTGRVFKQEVFDSEVGTEKDDTKFAEKCKSVLGIVDEFTILTAKAFCLGTLTRMKLVPNLIFRFLFNLFTWRDPYLTFWFSNLLFCLIIVLIVFPWRLFFFSLALVLLGPQNWIFQEKIKNKIRKVMQKSKQKKEKKQADSEKDPLLTKTDHTDTWSKLDNRQGIVVPYGMIRRERFYHWPPYSDLSSALPSERKEFDIRFPHGEERCNSQINNLKLRYHLSVKR